MATLNDLCLAASGVEATPRGEPFASLALACPVALRFPERRNDTTATVPYYFQHTNTPGGGPQESCWNPKGRH